MAIDFNSIFQQIMDAQDAANVANEKRYREILSSLGGLGKQVDVRFGEAAGQLAKLGEAGRTRIETGATKSIAASEQDLISRGLGTSTIRMTAQRGILSDAERSRQELEEGIAAQKAGLSERRAGAEMQLGGMKAGVMERRTDAGPDLGMYASLLQAAAASEKADAATAKRTSRIMGPMAQAGRDVFGQPFKYGGGGGGGLGAQGGGGGGGGGAAPTGGGLTGTVTGAARGPDAVGVPSEGGPGGVGFFGSKGAVSTAPAGEQPWAPGATAAPTAAEALGERAGLGILRAQEEDAAPGTTFPPAPIGAGEEAKAGGPFKTYEEYAAYQRSVGRAPINRIAWKYGAAGTAARR